MVSSSESRCPPRAALIGSRSPIRSAIVTSGVAPISRFAHDRNALVEEAGEGAEDPALGLAAQAEENEMVPRQNGVDQLRDDRVLVADDAGQQGISRFQAAEEVGAELVPHASAAERRLGPRALAELAEGAGEGGRIGLSLHY